MSLCFPLSVRCPQFSSFALFFPFSIFKQNHTTNVFVFFVCLSFSFCLSVFFQKLKVWSFMCCSWLFMGPLEWQLPFPTSPLWRVTPPTANTEFERCFYWFSSSWLQLELSTNLTARRCWPTTKCWPRVSCQLSVWPRVGASSVICRLAKWVCR